MKAGVGGGELLVILNEIEAKFNSDNKLMSSFCVLISSLIVTKTFLYKGFIIIKRLRSLQDFSQFACFHLGEALPDQSQLNNVKSV